MGYFFGRKKELLEINHLLRNQYEGLLIGVTGRRRVGKTFFISHCLSLIDDSLSFKFIGNPSLSSEENILWNYSEFLKQLEQYGISTSLFQNNLKANKNNLNSWHSFFLKVDIILNKIQNDFPNKKIILFFDEVNWYCKNTNFIKYFANQWNQYWSSNSSIITFLSGSIISWMQDKVFHNVDILYNRFHKIIELKPFSIFEIKEFIYHQYKNIPIDTIIQYYLMFGGIIKYYQYLDFKLSLEQNLHNLKSNKIIENEYRELFNGFSVDSKKSHLEIIMALSQSKNLSIQNLFLKVNELRLENNKDKIEHINNLYPDLKELNLMGFIINVKSIYQINDLFCFFTYYWNKNKNYLDTSSHKYNNWKGIAFELLIFNQFFIIAEYLNLPMNDAEIIINYNEIKQIDLLYKHKRNYIVIEMKNYKDTFFINNEVAQNIFTKCDIIKSKNIKNTVSSLIIANGNIRNITNSNDYPILTLSFPDILNNYKQPFL